MSVKFKETIQQSVGQAGLNAVTGGVAGGLAGGVAGNMAGMAQQAASNFSGVGPDGKKHGLLHDAGAFLTQGGGAKGYLQAYIATLEKYPVRTKMLTSGTLAGLQEFLASYIAQDRSKDGHYLNSRIPKMALYGAFISAPMGHFMIKCLQWLFKDRTGLGSKIAMIAISNLFIAPIQNAVYLFSMAIIAGARTFHQIRATIRAGFWPVMRVSWISSPIALAFAQAFLPQELWVPFFNLLAFVVGTYINTITKKKRLAALRRKYSEGRDSRGSRGDRDETVFYERTETTETRD